MTDHVASALFVYTEKTAHFCEPLQNNSFDARITPVAFDELMQNSHELLKGEGHVVVSGEAYAVMLNAMNHCSNPREKKCINAKIRSTTDIMGVMGNITIGTNGKAQRPIVINTIKDNQVKFIVKVY